MNFEFSADQMQLKDIARKFLEKEESVKRARKVLEGEESFDQDLCSSTDKTDLIKRALHY